MTQTFLPERPHQHRNALLALVSLWLLLFFAALFSPPVLDDADATHASAARHIAITGDWVTLHVNGVRYLEKAPLSYWLVALCFKIFGFNTFATHLPQAIAVLLLALLGYRWSNQAFGPRTAFYTGLATLTSTGVFLFTRIFIPEILLCLFLCTALYCLLRSLPASFPDKIVILSEGGAFAAEVEGPAFRTFSPTIYAYLLWAALALAVLTKGLVALVFFLGTATLYLALTGDYKRWRGLKPFTGTLLFLVIAAPWHILAGLRNTGGENAHGFFWFYFVNEHLLRFLGRRIPMDYNKLPSYLYWSLNFVWLFPWALFAGLLVREAIACLRSYNESNPLQSDQISYWQPFAVAVIGILLRDSAHVPYLFTVFIALVLFAIQSLRRRQIASLSNLPLLRVETIAERTTLLLTLFSAFVLIFFSLSTNQEYYTFPAYLSLLILLCAALARAEQHHSQNPSSNRWTSARGLIEAAHATFTLIGLAIAIALAYGLWTSRHLPFVPDIGDLLAHRGVGNYTLSMSHLFDLTGPSFAALRLPATLAAVTFAIGPTIAWILRRKQHHLAAISTIALTSAIFFIAAHLAFIRFTPMLSSKDFAEKIQQLQSTGAISSTRQVIFYGDQSYGSSILFYLGEQVELVDGRSSSMLFGSTFRDAPPIFLTPAQLLTSWGVGPRKMLFVPLEHRDDVDHLLGDRKILLAETSGKALFTDRPLDTAVTSNQQPTTGNQSASQP